MTSHNIHADARERITSRRRAKTRRIRARKRESALRFRLQLKERTHG